MKKVKLSVRIPMRVLIAALLCLFCLSAAAGTVRDAFEVAENTAYHNHGLSTYKPTSVIENLESGWLLDNRGGALRSDVEAEVKTLTDVSTTEGMALIREFNTLRDEVLTADFTLKTVGEDVFVQFVQTPIDIIKSLNHWLATV